MTSNNEDFYQGNEHHFVVRKRPTIEDPVEERERVMDLLAFYQANGVSFWLLPNKDLYIHFDHNREDVDPALIARANDDGAPIRCWLIAMRHVMAEFREPYEEDEEDEETVA